MHLNRLHLHHVRNLSEILIHPTANFNIFVGKNGSGKTSLLEAIHLLALGRSFRSRQTHSVIAYEADALSCFGEVEEAGQKTPMGIEKNRLGEVKCKIAGEICSRLSQLATLLPVQLITPDTFKLLMGASEERRRFLDWGVFHVEHSFGACCQRYQRLLKQRNAALKHPRNGSPSIWEKELAEVGEKITFYRKEYLKDLLPAIQIILKRLLPTLNLQVQYLNGWD